MAEAEKKSNREQKVSSLHPSASQMCGISRGFEDLNFAEHLQFCKETIYKVITYSASLVNVMK